MLQAIPSTRSRSLTIAVSIATHLVVLFALLYTRAPWIAPMRLPGTANGSHMLLTYLPGSAPAHTTSPLVSPAPKLTRPSPLPSIKPAPPQKPETSPNPVDPAAAHPDSQVGSDSFGSGNVEIALNRYFPQPHPDLSPLPQGTHGSVVLEIVIDATGKISDIQLASGLGHGVDDAVIAVVRQWTYQPATKDGKPIPSEQELRFYYEKA